MQGFGELTMNKKIAQLSKLLAIGSLLSGILINPVLAEEQLLSTLTVTGRGVEKIATTLTEVTLGVEVEGKTAAEVQQQLAKQTSAVVDLLRSKNVEQLQTTGIQLQPNYNYSNNQRNLIGYIGINKVSFRLKTEEVGALLDEAVTAGASRIDEINFTATPEAITEAQKKALRQATIDAQAMADVVLKTLNLTSKEIVGVRVNQANVPPPMPVPAAKFSQAAEATTPIIGGEQTVSASVTLQIGY